MKLSELIRHNYAWSSREWIIIQQRAADDFPPDPILCSPVDAAMAYGDEHVLCFDGDLVYLE